MNAHEIDYEIHGEEMQYVEIELDPQEAVVAEAGSYDDGFRHKDGYHFWGWFQSGQQCSWKNIFSW